MKATELLWRDMSDDLLYHYTAASTCLEHILYDRKLKFGQLSKTNDPLEFEAPLHSLVGTDTPRGDLAKSMDRISELKNPSIVSRSVLLR